MKIPRIPILYKDLRKFDNFSLDSSKKLKDVLKELGGDGPLSKYNPDGVSWFSHSRETHRIGMTCEMVSRIRFDGRIERTEVIMLIRVNCSSPGGISSWFPSSVLLVE